VVVFNEAFGGLEVEVPVNDAESEFALDVIREEGVSTECLRILPWYCIFKVELT